MWANVPSSIHPISLLLNKISPLSGQLAKWDFRSCGILLFDSWLKYGQNIWTTTSGPEVRKLFSCSTQLSMKFVLLINLKLPTTANSFLLYIAEHENFSANKFEIFIFIWRKNFMLSWVEHEKSFITSGPDKRINGPLVHLRIFVLHKLIVTILKNEKYGYGSGTSLKNLWSLYHTW